MATIFAVGNILFGHFEERTPKWRRLAKFAAVTGLAVGVSAAAGRAWFFALLGAAAAAVAVVHGWWLPRQGVNGWTGEPRERYYRLRGWAWPPTGSNVTSDAPADPPSPSSPPLTSARR